MTDWRTTRAGKRWLALYGHRKKVRMTWLAWARLQDGDSVAKAARKNGLSPRAWEAWERMVNRKTPGPRALSILLCAYPMFVPFAWARFVGRPYVTVNPATLEVVP
jgi:hypothetical protein